MPGTSRPTEAGVGEAGGGQPLLVWSDELRAYDFGPAHPLTPLRFGPGIALLEALGSVATMAPQMAEDEALGRLHDRGYIEAIRATSRHPSFPIAAGVGTGDVPAFSGMHEAAARIAGGSVDAVQDILAGRATHAFNPAGGLHHAMADRASGFCIYNDVALGVAAARDAGHRVLYVDLDVHHGDGTQALFWDDPEVLTVSIHESGRTLFPGTGSVEESGAEDARGTSVNIPLDAGAGDESWWPVVETSVGVLADAFRPSFLVSQHGCDSHAWNPLAHLRVTTAAYRRACSMLDRLAHDHCDGRWLATGGGGYDAYRVVPRSWAIIWLTQAHRELPATAPPTWRAAWEAAAERYGQAPMPSGFLDPAGTVSPDSPDTIARHRMVAERSVEASLEALGSG